MYICIYYIISLNNIKNKMTKVERNLFQIGWPLFVQNRSIQYVIYSTSGAAKKQIFLPINASLILVK